MARGRLQNDSVVPFLRCLEEEEEVSLDNSIPKNTSRGKNLKFLLT